MATPLDHDQAAHGISATNCERIRVFGHGKAGAAPVPCGLPWAKEAPEVRIPVAKASDAASIRSWECALAKAPRAEANADSAFCASVKVPTPWL